MIKIDKITIINNHNGHCYLSADSIDEMGRNKTLLLTNIKTELIQAELEYLIKLCEEKLEDVHNNSLI